MIFLRERLLQKGEKFQLLGKAQEVIESIEFQSKQVARYWKGRQSNEATAQINRDTQRLSLSTVLGIENAPNRQQNIQ